MYAVQYQLVTLMKARAKDADLAEYELNEALNDVQIRKEVQDLMKHGKL